jgi:hypothetical protein
MSNFTTNSKTENPADAIKKLALKKVDKVASKIPGYTKVKGMANKAKDAGFSLDVGKNKIGISYNKKF